MLHTFNMGELLDLAIEKNASDIHLGAGKRVALRIHGHIVFVDGMDALSESTAEEAITALLSEEGDKEKLQQHAELDFSHVHTDGTVFSL